VCKDEHELEPCTTGASGSASVGEDLTDPNRQSCASARQATATRRHLTPPPPNALDSCPGQADCGVTEPLISRRRHHDAKDKGKGKPGGAVAVGGGGGRTISITSCNNSGALAMKVQGLGALNSTLYLRSTCDDETTQLACG